MGYQAPVTVEVVVGRREDPVRRRDAPPARSSSTRRSRRRPSASSRSRASREWTPPAAPRSPRRRSSTRPPRRSAQGLQEEVVLADPPLPPVPEGEEAPRARFLRRPLRRLGPTWERAPRAAADPGAVLRWPSSGSSSSWPGPTDRPSTRRTSRTRRSSTPSSSWPWTRWSRSPRPWRRARGSGRSSSRA